MIYKFELKANYEIEANSLKDAMVGVLAKVQKNKSLSDEFLARLSIKDICSNSEVF